MSGKINRGGGGQLLQLEHSLAYALLAAETPADVMRIALPFLIEQTCSDGGAFGLSSTGQAVDYRWHVDGLPEGFLAEYAQHSDADFIRQHTARQPNLVLRDTEMVSRRSFLDNHFVQSSADHRFPIRRVMGVIVPKIGFGEGGVALYRTRCRPYSAQERDRLAATLHVLAAKVRSTALFAQLRVEAEAARRVHEALGRGVVLVDPRGRIQYLNSRARALMVVAYPDIESSGDARLPEDLANQLRYSRDASWVVERASLDGLRTVQLSCAELTGLSQSGWWYITLNDSGCAPPAWTSVLKEHEQRVVERALRGWSNRTIADDLEITEGAVKKRLERSYDKLGVPNRATMIAAARRGTT